LSQEATGRFFQKWIRKIKPLAFYPSIPEMGLKIPVATYTSPFAPRKSNVAKMTQDHPIISCHTFEQAYA
jgi:hypothetical protein